MMQAFRIIQMQAFRDASNHCQLDDLGFNGEIFTWANSITKCRLDRNVATRRLRIWPPLTSNHVPILLEVRQSPVVPRQKHKHFRFEEAWLERDGCEQMVAMG